MNEEKNLCEDCVFSNEPFGIFPKVCVAGKKSKLIWHEVNTCKQHKTEAEYNEFEE